MIPWHGNVEHDHIDDKCWVFLIFFELFVAQLKGLLVVRFEVGNIDNKECLVL